MRKIPCLSDIDFIPYNCNDRLLSYIRKGKNDESSLFVAVNAGDNTISVEIPKTGEKYETILGAKPGDGILDIAPLGYSVIKFNAKDE